MDLEIKYNNGSMVVHFDAFLNECNISKFRKLVKVIQYSFNPDDLHRVKSYIEQEFEQLEPTQRENEKYVIGYEDKKNFCQRQLENNICNRGRFKKNTSGWQHYNNNVKQLRQELQEINALLRSHKSICKKCIKNKQFYMKCLENIS